MQGSEHWVSRDSPAGAIRLFLWRKPPPAGAFRGTILFVHGSSMASRPEPAYYG